MLHSLIYKLMSDVLLFILLCSFLLSKDKQEIFKHKTLGAHKKKIKVIWHHQDNKRLATR